MQILKVLLVVLVAVNLSNGLFFKKKKKVYVHHPPPPPPVYAPVPQYTYSYYYQPVPYYYYEPVYVTPQQHPTPAPYSANTHPVQSSGRQALPAFDAANFNGKPEVEIVPSVGFQMGTKTDVIEVLKSPGVEVPVQPVQTDAGSTTVLIDELNPDNDVKLSSGGVIPIANAQASSASSFSSTDLLLNSVPTVIDVGSRGSFDGRNGKRGAGTVEVFKSPANYRPQ
ncbi:uncharacterized protein LOC118503791 isoform X2 [Anopheles stephensi]|uniref:uncharacterized protein LOC118503791 isoform X2 n=1 Tax=Anopheles stephensi TaxID=30069 RepID=UPI0016589C4D|nr:uncharacterized protein LOC118503791 isoform X2 [Anopheles stephensi]